MVKHTTEMFIEKAKIIHGDRYDYSKVEYNGNKIKVIIICKIHGEFEQTPSCHSNDKLGCFKCLNRITNTKEFIERDVISAIKLNKFINKLRKD